MNMNLCNYLYNIPSLFLFSREVQHESLNTEEFDIYSTLPKSLFRFSFIAFTKRQFGFTLFIDVFLLKEGAYFHYYYRSEGNGIQIYFNPK